jgi:hypothetical protein
MGSTKNRIDYQPWRYTLLTAQCNEFNLMEHIGWQILGNQNYHY